MCVESSLSISILSNGKLWGLICCHSVAPLKISIYTRKFLTVFSKFLSKAIESLNLKKRLNSRSLITAKASSNISGSNLENTSYLASNSEDLLQLLASGAFKIVKTDRLCRDFN